MNELARIKLAVTHLVSKGVGCSQKEIGRLMGYRNESSFSQILNGKVGLPKNFIIKLAELDSDISRAWLSTGVGNMLLSENAENVGGEANISYFKDSNLDEERIDEESLKFNDMEKNLLMELLKGSQSQIDQFLSQQEKMLSQQDELIAIIKNLTSRKGEEADSEKKSRIGQLPREKGELGSSTDPMK